MEKTLHDMSTGNQPDGSTYEIYGCISVGRLLALGARGHGFESRHPYNMPSKLMWTGTPLLTEG